MTGEVPARELREAYEAFCKEMGESPLHASELGKRLASGPVQAVKKGGNRMYIGVSLR